MALANDSALLVPAGWVAKPTATLAAELRDKKHPTGRRFVCRTGSGLRPVDAYVYLKARFGPANGVMMLLKSPSTDNLFHWHFVLEAAGARLEFYGVATRLEIQVVTTEPFEDSDWARIAGAVKLDMSRVGAQMAECRRTLEPWRVFVNPYARVRRIVDSAAKRLEELAPTLRSFPPDPTAGLDQGKANSQQQALFERQAEAMTLGTTIRMLCPVVGEALVNLLLFLLAQPHVRSDSRVYDATIRAEIDVRVKSLPHTCRGFIRAPKDSDEEFKGFHSLMNNRNFLLHGNVDPRRLTVEELFFDPPRIPLFPLDQNFFERTYSLQLAHIEPADALSDYFTIRVFVPYLLACLEPTLVPSVEAFLRDPYPGIRTDTGLPGILFSDTAVDAWFGEDTD